MGICKRVLFKKKKSNGVAARVEAAQNQMGSFLVGKRRPKAKASFVAQANNCFEKHVSLRIEGWQVVCDSVYF